MDVNPYQCYQFNVRDYEYYEYHTYPPQFYLRRSADLNTWTYKIKRLLITSQCFRVFAFSKSKVGGFFLLYCMPFIDL